MYTYHFYSPNVIIRWFFRPLVCHKACPYTLYMGQKFIYMTRLPLRNGFGWPYFFFRFFSRLRMKSLAHVQFFGVETIRCEKSPVLSFLKSVVLIFLHAVNTNRVQACLFLFSIRHRSFNYDWWHPGVPRTNFRGAKDFFQNFSDKKSTFCRWNFENLVRRAKRAEPKSHFCRWFIRDSFEL